ncbi:hypothetical protein EYC84_007827 [Monilinia fructicola]|uniref:Uncharacterized protein n=1 Tax=Monilinia fructicola TaxID=38448 RepID=A0A5M9JJD4_MONFR|nr:hypothetical protein EYC84_007827 [Monilinia fructicola]
MLEKLFDQGRENAEYRNASNEVANDEVVTSLAELEKLKVLECAIYKKLFGDDRTGTETSDSSVVDKNNNTLVDSHPSEASSLVKTNISYADQAAKEPPPPKAPELTFMQKRHLAITADAKKRMGEAAWNRLLVEGRQAQEAAFKLDDIMDRRRRLLPMMPGGIIHQYSSFAPANWNCENIWSAEDGKQIKKAEEKTQDKVPLTTCLGWFLLGDDCPRYREFIKKSINPKPKNSVEATKFFQAQIQDSWKKLPGVIARENREHDEIKNRSSEYTGTIPQPILKDTWKQRQVNEEGVSRQMSKESSFIDANGVTHVKRKAAEEADKTTNKKMKGPSSPEKVRMVPFGVVEADAKGEEKITPAKDSRGVTHISKEAADKADERLCQGD